MARNPWDSYKTVLELRKRINDLFQQSMISVEAFREMRTEGPSWMPPFDMLETEDEFLLFGELPGILKEDLEIQLKGNELTVRGERRPEMADSVTHYQLAERFSGGFQRRFQLPEQIIESKVSTSLNEGLLEIRLPKRKPRTITIQ